MIDKEKTDKNLEIRVWDTCHPLGKALIISGIYFGLDFFTHLITGNHIYDYIGFKIPEEEFYEISNTFLLFSGLYGIYKAWIEEVIWKEKYYDKYEHLARPPKRKNK